MQTAQIVSSITCGGINFTSSVSRQAEGQISHVVVLPAGVAGAISATGVDGLVEGHGIEASDVIDVHWSDPADGSHKCRRGLTVDTAGATSIAFDEDPAGAGDALPAEDTAVVVSVQVSIDTDFDGDLVQMVAVKTAQRAMVDFRKTGASLLAIKCVAGEAWSWASGQSVANPLTGDPVDAIVVSNGSVSETTMYVGILYESV